MTPTRRDVLAGTIGALTATPSIPALAAGTEAGDEFLAACRETEAAWRRLLDIENRMNAAGVTFVRADDYRIHDALLRSQHSACLELEQRCRAEDPSPATKSWQERWRRSRKWSFGATRRNAELRKRFGALSAEWGLETARAAARSAEARERRLAAARPIAFTRFDPPLADRSFAINSVFEPTRFEVGDDYHCIRGALFEAGGKMPGWGALTPDEFAAATYVRRMEELGYRFDGVDDAYALTDDALADAQGDAARLCMRAVRTPGIKAAIDLFLHERADRFHRDAERWPFPGSEWRTVLHLTFVG